MPVTTGDTSNCFGVSVDFDFTCDVDAGAAGFVA